MNHVPLHRRMAVLKHKWATAKNHKDDGYKWRQCREERRCQKEREDDS